MSKSLSKSPQLKGKNVGRKDKQLLRQKHRRQLQQAKLQQQRQQARVQLQKLKQTGLVNAYEQFLRSICKNGLPQSAIVYQQAAQFILKYQKKLKQKQQKKQSLQKYNKQRQMSRSIDYSRVDSPQKSIGGKSKATIN